jgi:hypothetical protein
VPQPIIYITETVYIGQSLTANIVDLKGTINFQWKLNGNEITGTNRCTYIVQTSDIGSFITVTASLSGDPGSVTSDPYEVQKAGIDIGGPFIRLFLDGSPLENGETTIFNREAELFLVSIASGIYTEIIWHVNGSVWEQGATKTSITLSKQTLGIFNIMVTATPAGGVTNSGSHTFVIQ